MVVVSEGELELEYYDVALIDLGTAEPLTVRSELIEAKRGTHSHEAPEQALRSDSASATQGGVKGGRSGLASDVYALGSTLLYVMSGILPWIQPKPDAAANPSSKPAHLSIAEIQAEMKLVCRTAFNDRGHAQPSFIDPTSKWDSISANAKPIPYLTVLTIKQMLQTAMGARPTAAEVLLQLDAVIQLATGLGFTVNTSLPSLTPPPISPTGQSSAHATSGGASSSASSFSTLCSANGVLALTPFIQSVLRFVQYPYFRDDPTQP
jgi:serine/threonine protein kinase